MTVTGINQISQAGNYDYSSVKKTDSNRNQAFESVFQSALDGIDNTNSYINQAEEEEIKFALGESDSLVDLQNAQLKANISLQYTVAVKNSLVEAYKELMNLQF